MFATLTLPHRFGSRLQANRELGARFRRFQSRLNKRLARRDQPPISYFWIREVHKDGWPHLHCLIVHEGVAELVAGRDRELESHPEVKGADRTLAPIELRALAEDCGFGDRFDLQLAISRNAVLGYASKVCVEIDDRAGLVGEVTKGSQVPELLPPHCRSYGYSRGFIPPRQSSGEWHGWVLDDLQRVIARAPKLEPVDIRARLLAGPPDAPVFDLEQPMARWETSNEAKAYIEGSLSCSVGRSYRLCKTLTYQDVRQAMSEGKSLGELKDYFEGRTKLESKSSDGDDTLLGEYSIDDKNDLRCVAAEFQGTRFMRLGIWGPSKWGKFWTKGMQVTISDQWVDDVGLAAVRAAEMWSEEKTADTVLRRERGREVRREILMVWETVEKDGDRSVVLRVEDRRDGVLRGAVRLRREGAAMLAMACHRWARMEIIPGVPEENEIPF